MAEAPAALAAKLAEIRLQFIRELPSLVSSIRRFLESGLAGDTEAMGQAHKLAHRLSGSGGTFGVNEVSQSARALEVLLKAVLEAELAPDAATAGAIEDRLASLEGACRSAGAAEPASQFETFSALQPPVASRPKVLIVEDVSEQRNALLAALSEEPWDFIAAADGLDGVRTAFEAAPDVIVTDVMMPGISGYHLCRFLRSSPQFARTPILVLTALGEQLDRFWAERCGADRFLVKSSDFTGLRTAVRELLAASGRPQSTVRRSTLHIGRSAISEQVAGLMDSLLRESTLREEIAGLGRRAGSLAEFLESSLALIGQLTSVDSAAMLLEFDGAVTIATSGAGMRQQEELLERCVGSSIGSERTVDWHKFHEKRQARPVRHCLVASLDAHGQAVGRIGIFRGEEAGEFKPAERRLFELVARELAGIAAVAWGRETIARKNRELVDLNQMKDRLSELLVHDVKNAAWAISLAVESLADRIELDEAQTRILADARNGSRLLTDMLVSLLDIAKMEEASLTVRAGPVDLGRLGREVIGPHEGRSRRRGIEMSVGPAASGAHGDADLLRRVLSNLVANAVKHTYKGSIRIEFDAEPAGDSKTQMTRITVRDTGAGIAAEHLGKLFEKFVQAQERKSGGSGLPLDRGLGLYFCRLAVEAHGGRIWAESSPGKGSAFCFTVPSDETSYEAIRPRR